MTHNWLVTSAKATLATVFTICVAHAALAQSVPTPVEQEVLVKNSLLTFNDANVTGNYTVLHDKGSKPFRDELSADKLKDSFKDFADKHINFDIIAVKPITPSGEAKIDGDGQLSLEGVVVISDSRKITYKFDYIRSEGEWKLIGLNVKQ